MALSSRKLFFKYAKVLVIVTGLAFLTQIVIAVYLLNAEYDDRPKKFGYVSVSQQEIGDVSARKLSDGLINDENFFKIKEHSKLFATLRLEELDFKPACDIKSREAISAVNRAKTQSCKQEIVNKSCLIQNSIFYPTMLPNSCQAGDVTYGKHLGCFVDDKKMRLLSGFYGNFVKVNTPTFCLDICVQAGFPYAGVEYGNLCRCMMIDVTKEKLNVPDCKKTRTILKDILETQKENLNMNNKQTWETMLNVPSCSHEPWPLRNARKENVKVPVYKESRCLFQDSQTTITNVRELLGASHTEKATECFCGENAPPLSAITGEDSCDMKCSGNSSSVCGGYFTMNVFETGLAKFVPRTPITKKSKADSVRIVFLLTLNGRALRQVYRLINSLYRDTHYFYIHVDSRQHYLHRELSTLEKEFPNIKLAGQRYSTIWGGASLLTMLLAAVENIIELDWQWDFVINLSESDFPIKSLERLEGFLSVNKGLNFVKSHGREVQRFIKKQGLDKTFIECETRMWRVGDRKLPKGIVIDGGSDWVALSIDFVSFIIDNMKEDELLSGLNIIFKHTLLPAESFFHTVLRNSHFCCTYVDNNLHVTNWKRKLGCKCQYKHVVDWCGCSPNDFRIDDWARIQNTQDRQLFFARKFEPIINQEIITRVEQFIGFDDHHLINNLKGYWQNIYNVEDLTASTDDLFLTHAASISRNYAKILETEACHIFPDEVQEIHSYHYGDVYKGNLILDKVFINNTDEVLIEIWYKPKQLLDLNFENQNVDNMKTFKVSSDYDQKEMLFRNLANILGPLSEPVLLYEFSPPVETTFNNLTVMWLDPAGMIADVVGIYVNENNLTNFIKPSLKVPLLPGIWKVGLFEHSNLIASTKFLITPLQYFSAKEVSYQQTSIIHSGSQNSYKNYSYVKPISFLPSREEILLLQKKSYLNVKRLHHDLREWIDSLSIEFYSILGSCIVSPKIEVTCGIHKFEFCSSTEWSSLAPDPKGSIGKLNQNTGRLERT